MTLKMLIQEAKVALVSRDWEIVLEMAKCHQSTKHISDPRIASSWCKLWDLALDHGVRGTRLIQHLLRVMCRPVFGKPECPICNNFIHESTSYFEHVCSDHCSSEISVEGVLEAIEEGDQTNILAIATTLSNSLFSCSIIMCILIYCLCIPLGLITNLNLNLNLIGTSAI